MASFSRLAKTIDYRQFEITREPGVIAGGDAADFAKIDVMAHILIDGFRVEDVLDESGAQSNIYLVRKHAQQYAMKIYRRGFAPSSEVQKVLANGECPSIAPVIAAGRYKGDYWYEVFPYYSSGTLDDLIERTGKCSPVFVERKLLPAIDEALNYLHSKGLVHADVKPSNIFITEDGGRVVLGDFGIAGLLAGKDGLVPFRGTLEYAPNVLHSGNQVRIDESYDYGALGLVLIKAYTGYSIFSGMSLEERDKAILSLHVPESIPPKGRALIQGLLRHDALTRYGHRECQIFMQEEQSIARPTSRRGRRRISSPEKESRRKTLEFGYFDDQVIIVDSKESLLQACEAHWDGARSIIDAPKLERFLRVITGSNDFYEQYVSQYKRKALDERVFWLCCGLRLETNGPSDHSVAYKGTAFPSIVQLLKHLDRNPESEIISLLDYQVLPEYLRHFGYGEGAAIAVADILKQNRPNSEKASMITAICDSSCHSIHIEGSLIDTVDEFLAAMMNLPYSKLNELVENPSLKPWLHKHGCDFVIAEMEAFE